MAEAQGSSRARAEGISITSVFLQSGLSLLYRDPLDAPPSTHVHPYRIGRGGSFLAESATGKWKNKKSLQLTIHPSSHLTKRH